MHIVCPRVCVHIVCPQVCVCTVHVRFYVGWGMMSCEVGIA